MKIRISFRRFERVTARFHIEEWLRKDYLNKFFSRESYQSPQKVCKFNEL
jgi:hypothetical protein